MTAKALGYDVLTESVIETCKSAIKHAQAMIGGR
jgi:hypothetical protein